MRRSSARIDALPHLALAADNRAEPLWDTCCRSDEFRTAFRDGVPDIRQSTPFEDA